MDSRLASEHQLRMARLAAAVVMTGAVLAGCFVLLIGPPNDRTQTAAIETATIIITAWITYFAAVAGR